MKIIYIHGFNSAGTGNDKAKLLADHFGDVIAPDLPVSPHAAIAKLIDVIDSLRDEDGDLPSDLILVGSSLGGFYTHYLAKKFGIKCVLINPSLNPLKTLGSKVGTHTNYATGVTYELTGDIVLETATYYVDARAGRTVPTLVCLDMGDDVLDANIAAAHFHGTAKLLMFPGGDHRFQHMTDILPEIAALENVIAL